MPAPRKITDDPEVVAAMLADTDLPTVARHYDVSPTAIQQFLRRHNLYQRKMPDHSDVIPWRLADRHGMDHVVRMLRLYGRRLKGFELTPKETSILDNWVEQMDEKNAIVTYDRVHGFRYAYREPGEVGYARPNRQRSRV